MEIFAKSDIGLIRSSNQDECRFGIISENTCWAIVCDGMGGANAGNVASSVAVNTIEEHIKNNYNESFSQKETGKFLTSMVEMVNDKLYKMQENDSSLKGMGTTIEVVLVTPLVTHIIHVGDSRVYAIRESRIKQITTDHSFVQEMVDSGKITPEEAQKHPSKNFITRALGVNKDIYLDYIEAESKKDDIFIVCTDGLTNYVTMDDILKMAKENKGEPLAELLIETAKERGGADNITVAVLYA